MSEWHGKVEYTSESAQTSLCDPFGTSAHRGTRMDCQSTQAASSNKWRQACLQAMSLDKRSALEALKEGTNITIEDWEDNCDDMSFGDVWNGTEPLTISHAGGEFTDLAREVLEDFWKMNNVFSEQMAVMTNTYLAWSLAKCKEAFGSFFERLKREELESDSDCGRWSISVIDVFCE
ncbi:hypothetical protein F4604DRAFT_1904249 [Suillus subluteus]|nr:hypothetical protein F4604DRAFT_1904249 [Suillus subluteus]